MSSRLRQIPLHPLLAAVYPVLALLANNISQVRPAVALRPLVVVCCLAILLWGFLFVLIRDVRRSALIASWWLALFFMYGHVYFFLGERTSLGHHRFLLPLWIFLAVGGSWWIIKRVKDLAYITLALNGIALALLVFPLVQMGSSSLSQPLVPEQQVSLPLEFASLRIPEQQIPPDIITSSWMPMPARMSYSEFFLSIILPSRVGYKGRVFMWLHAARAIMHKQSFLFLHPFTFPMWKICRLLYPRATKRLTT